MNPGTFLHNTDRMITGFGFKRSVPCTTQLRMADGSAMTTTATNEGTGAIETSFIGLIGNSGGTFGMNLLTMVPWDYDQSIDIMKVRFLAQMAGNTNTAVKFDAALYQKKVATALSSDLNPTISAAVPVLTSLAGWVEIKASGLGLVAGSGLDWVITLDGTHTSDALYIYAAEIEYYSDLVYYNREIRRS